MLQKFALACLALALVAVCWGTFRRLDTSNPVGQSDDEEVTQAPPGYERRPDLESYSGTTTKDPGASADSSEHSIELTFRSGDDSQVLRQTASVFVAQRIQGKLVPSRLMPSDASELSGEDVVLVQVPGHLPVWMPWGKTQETHQLKPLDAIRGRVLGPDSSPVEGAVVRVVGKEAAAGTSYYGLSHGIRLHETGAMFESRTLSGPDGRFEISLIGDDGDLRISAPGLVWIERAAAPRTGAATPVGGDYRLSRVHSCRLAPFDDANSRKITPTFVFPSAEFPVRKLRADFFADFTDTDASLVARTDGTWDYRFVFASQVKEESWLGGKAAPAELVVLAEGYEPAHVPVSPRDLGGDAIAFPMRRQSKQGRLSVLVDTPNKRTITLPCTLRWLGGREPDLDVGWRTVEITTGTPQEFELAPGPWQIELGGRLIQSRSGGADSVFGPGVVAARRDVVVVDRGVSEVRFDLTEASLATLRITYSAGSRPNRFNLIARADDKLLYESILGLGPKLLHVFSNAKRAPNTLLLVVPGYKAAVIRLDKGQAVGPFDVELEARQP